MKNKQASMSEKNVVSIVAEVHQREDHAIEVNDRPAAAGVAHQGGQPALKLVGQRRDHQQESRQERQGVPDQIRRAKTLMTQVLKQQDKTENPRKP